MLDINMEVRRGILFIRLFGNLDKNTSKYFKNEVTNLVESKGLKYLVINLSNLESIDNTGIELIMNEYRYIAKVDGKVVICGINNNSNIKQKYFKNLSKSDNELQAFNIINI